MNPVTCDDLPVRFLQKPTNHFVAPHLNPHERSTHRPLMKTTSTLLTTLVLAIGGLTRRSSGRSRRQRTDAQPIVSRDGELPRPSREIGSRCGPSWQAHDADA